MQLPQHIIGVLSALENGGFAAYAVGGCVRDMLRGVQPADWDVTTSALPQQVCEVFARCTLYTFGLRHGTVGVRQPDGSVCEITTMRADGAYSDGRHPDSVAFVADIRRDLARRDFTVNAMAYSPCRGSVDPFGGQKDLQNGVLRTVGQPQQRFAEDALRILRGVRFCAQLSLTAHPQTHTALLQSAPLLHGVAAERIGQELLRFLALPNAGEAAAQYAAVTAAALGADKAPDEALLRRLSAVPPQFTAARLAVLCSALGLEPAALSRFALGQPAQRAQALWAAPQAVQPTRAYARRLACRLGFAAAREYAVWQQVLGQDARPLMEQLRQAQLQGDCVRMADLCVNGHDAQRLGLRGAQIGKALHAALCAVMDGAQPNTREALLPFLQSYAK